MGTFRVELKKTVDDSYEIEVGRALAGRLVKDLEGGLMGGLKKFALITDSNVEDLYARPICQALQEAGFEGQVFSFPAGEESKTRVQSLGREDPLEKEMATHSSSLENPMDGGTW